MVAGEDYDHPQKITIILNGKFMLCHAKDAIEENGLAKKSGRRPVREELPLEPQGRSPRVLHFGLHAGHQPWGEISEARGSLACNG